MILLVRTWTLIMTVKIRKNWCLENRRLEQAWPKYYLRRRVKQSATSQRALIIKPQTNLNCLRDVKNSLTGTLCQFVQRHIYKTDDNNLVTGTLCQFAQRHETDANHSRWGTVCPTANQQHILASSASSPTSSTSSRTQPTRYGNSTWKTVEKWTIIFINKNSKQI